MKRGIIIKSFIVVFLFCVIPLSNIKANLVINGSVGNK